MKLTASIVGALLAWSSVAPAQSLDDQYVHLYTLVQQGDAFLEAGHGAAAAAKYTEAEAGFKKLQGSYPNWNERVVSFRLRYVQDKLKEAGGIGAKPAPVPPAGPGNPGPPMAPSAVTSAPGADVAALERQVRDLLGEKTHLEARLREALSAQPAAADPREFARAQERIRLLQKENDILKVSLAQEKHRATRAADPAVLEQVQTALANSNRQLADQADLVTSLRKENVELQVRVKNNPEIVQLRTENQTLRKEVSDLRLNSNLTAAAADIARQLADARTQVTILQARVETLNSEKAALESRQRDASAPAPTPPAAGIIPGVAESGALNAKLAALERELSDSRKLMVDATTAITRLQEEKAALVSKVAQYALQAATASGAPPSAPVPASGRLATTAATLAQPADERIQILRARLEILEARQVPYTKEELALFKTPETVRPSEATPSARMPAKLLPSGAATLVAQAERAFNERRLDDAERLYRQVVQMDARNAYTLANLAAIQLEKGQLAEAEGHLKRALAESPDDPYSLSLMGITQFRLNQTAESLDFLSRAAQLEPNNPETQNYLGVALSQKGLRAAAETALRKAVQLSPGYSSAHHNLAVVYATAQPPSVELARFHYDRAIASGHAKNDELEKILNRKRGASN